MSDHQLDDHGLDPTFPTMRLRGIEGYTLETLREAVEQGGRFHVFQYCIAPVIFTATSLSPAWFVPPGKSVEEIARRYNRRSLFFGVWSLRGIPTVLTCFAANRDGGVDVTGDIIRNLTRESLDHGVVQMQVAYTHFDHTRRGTLPVVVEGIRGLVQEEEGIREIWLGRYVNADPPFTTIGVRLDAVTERREELQLKTERAVKQALLRGVRFVVWDMDSLDEDVAAAFEEQGQLAYRRGEGFGRE